MHEVMQALAATMRNLGLDAQHGPDWVKVQGIVFYASQRYGRCNFTFLGRRYRTGNVTTAALDLVRELPRLLKQRDDEYEARLNYRRAEELTKRLDCGIVVRWTGHKFILTYETDDLAAVSDFAQKLSDAMSREWDDLLTQKLPGATFTAEGGFSIN